MVSSRAGSLCQVFSKAASARSTSHREGRTGSLVWHFAADQRGKSVRVRRRVAVSCIKQITLFQCGCILLLTLSVACS